MNYIEQFINLTIFYILTFSFRLSTEFKYSFFLNNLYKTWSMLLLSYIFVKFRDKIELNKQFIFICWNFICSSFLATARWQADMVRFHFLKIKFSLLFMKFKNQLYYKAFIFNNFASSFLPKNNLLNFFESLRLIKRMRWRWHCLNFLSENRISSRSGRRFEVDIFTSDHILRTKWAAQFSRRHFFLKIGLYRIKNSENRSVSNKKFWKIC